MMSALLTATLLGVILAKGSSLRAIPVRVQDKKKRRR